MSKKPPEPCMRVLGIDPGFASTGVAVVRCQGRSAKLLHGATLTTKKSPETRSAVKLRVSVDDSRRCRELYEAIDALVVEFRPNVLAVEAFVPSFGTGRGGGNAWKTAISFGVIQGVAAAHDTLALTFLPMDIRRRFKLGQGASKQDVAQAACEQVQGLVFALGDMRAALREHTADAASLALLGYEEMRSLRQATGMA